MSFIKKQKFFLRKQDLSTLLFFTVAALVFLPGISCQTDVKKVGYEEEQEGSEGEEEDSVEYSLQIATVVLDPMNTRQVAIYGEHGSRENFLQACGFAGKTCICEFFNNMDGANPVFTEDRENIQYDSVINLFYCTIPETEGTNTVSHARIRNRLETRQSNISIIKNMNPEEQEEEKQLKASDLLAGLPIQDLMEIYEYTCFFNYLEKPETTSDNFSCSPGPLAILQIPYHYYLFSNNGREEPHNNFSDRVPDLLYNDGTGSLCQETLREIDCTTVDDGPEDPNAPTLKFGIFDRSISFFTEPVRLASAPVVMGGIRTNYGFAVPVSAEETCPPGFELQRRYSALPEEIPDSTIDNGDIDDGVGSPINNIVEDFIIRNPREIEDLKLRVDRFQGGSCRREDIRGELCEAPSLDRSAENSWQTVQEQDYSPEGDDPFCAIPAQLIERELH